MFHFHSHWLCCCYMRHLNPFRRNIFILYTHFCGLTCCSPMSELRLPFFSTARKDKHDSKNKGRLVRTLRSIMRPSGVCSIGDNGHELPLAIRGSRFVYQMTRSEMEGKFCTFCSICEQKYVSTQSFAVELCKQCQEHDHKVLILPASIALVVGAGGVT